MRCLNVVSQLRNFTFLWPIRSLDYSGQVRSLLNQRFLWLIPLVWSVPSVFVGSWIVFLSIVLTLEVCQLYLWSWIVKARHIIRMWLYNTYSTGFIFKSCWHFGAGHFYKCRGCVFSYLNIQCTHFVSVVDYVLVIFWTYMWIYPYIRYIMQTICAHHMVWCLATTRWHSREK